MKKFALGFATCYVVFVKYNEPITAFLRKQIAVLELKQDLLRHDHPDLPR